MTRRVWTTSATPRLGFSLVEMVVSLAVVSVLLVGMTSAIVLASRALPTYDGPAAATVTTARVLHQLQDELRAATELLNLTATSATLHLPDRDGDGRPEIVTYTWAGSAGDPLTRVTNGSAAVTVLDNVESFALGYTTNTSDTVFPGPLITSSEQLLGSFVTNDTGNTEDHILLSNEWIGTLVEPSLPADTESWRITRALFYGNKRGGSGSTITYELRGVSGDVPNNTIYDAPTRLESTMSGWKWYETIFNSPEFAASQAASIVLANHGDGEAGSWSYYKNDLPPSQFFTGDGEGGWSTGSSGEELQHFVYGTYQYTGDDWTFTRPRINAVTVTLVASDAAASTHRLTVPLLNAPDAADYLLQADMAADPKTLDLDADGTPDWEVPDDASAGTMSDGVLTVRNELMRVGLDSQLNQPFVLELWLQDATDDGNPAKLEVKYDLDNGIGAKFKLYVERIGNAQMVTLYTHNPDHEDVEIHATTAPAGQMVDIKLVVDTDRDTLAIVVDDEAPHSYAYLRFHDDHTGEIKIEPDGSGSEILLDHIRLTVGGTTALTPNAYPGS